MTEQEIIDRERLRCIKICEGWIATFKDTDIKYTSPREYATDAINDIIDLICDDEECATELDLAYDHIHQLRDLVQTLIDNDPGEPIADNGMTVLDGWRERARRTLAHAAFKSPADRGGAA